MSKRIFGLVLLASAIGGHAAAQQQPAFSSTAPGAVPAGPRLILVDVIVSNEKVEVRDLKREDFVLEDKGKKQNIALFDVTESGKLKVPATPLPAGVMSNRLNSKGETQGTATVLLYDRINSDVQNQAFVRAQILRVLAALKPTDRLGFYSLGFGLSVVRDYNEDAGPLAKVAKAMLDSTTVPDSFTPDEKALFKSLLDSLTPTQDLNNQARVNITYPSFRSIARHLNGVLGRKNLVWITSRFPLTFGTTQERRQDDQKEFNTFKNNLLESNIVLFPVDPGGTGASFATPTGAPVANEGSLLPGRASNSAGGPTNQGDNSLMGNQGMLVLADATGGKAYRNANDIAPALTEIAALSEYTYTLGFYPDAKTLDGRNHDLKVTVNKKGGKIVVTHRKQYVAWSPDSQADDKLIVPFKELVEDGMPASGVGLMAVANPDPANPGTQIIDMRISAGDLHFEPQGDLFAMDFDIAFLVEGPGGQGGAKTYKQAITKEQFAGILGSGLEIREPVKTTAANGAIRIALLDKRSGANGSIRVPFHGAAPAAAPAK
jgi:VWFA-related protein